MKAIVFVVRGCSAGWLGAYGNEWVVTPNLDQFAAEGVVFDQHISDGPDPLEAGEAWLHGLHAAEVCTALVRANHPDTDAPSSYYAGWGEVFDARPQADDSPLDHLIQSLPSLLDKLADVPQWLVWVEVDRLLPPWDVSQEVFEAYLAEEEEEEKPPPDVREEPATPCADPPPGSFETNDLAAFLWLRMSFASVATKLDAELGEAFELLRSRGLDQTAAWLVTSDLGYPLGEHGWIGPSGSRLHEELVHVPLVLRLPGAAEAGRRVASFTQPADLRATLLSLFGASASVPGHNLLPLARGEEGSVRSFARSRSAEETAIRTAEWTYLFPLEPPRSPLLFARPDDRWEVNDVLSLHEEVVEQLETQRVADRTPGAIR